MPSDPISPGVAPALRAIKPFEDHTLYAAARQQVLQEYAANGASSALRKARMIATAFRDAKAFTATLKDTAA